MYAQIDFMELRLTMDQAGEFGNSFYLSLLKILSQYGFFKFFSSSITQLTPNSRPRLMDSPQHYLQSTVTTTSGLGSNYTSHNTTEPTNSSISSLVSEINRIPSKAKITASRFSECDEESDGNLYIQGENLNYPSRNLDISLFGVYFTTTDTDP